MRVFESAVIVGDEAGTSGKYLVEDKGRVVHVGDFLPEVHRSAPRTVLAGKAIVPALADTHTHFMSHALFASGLDVRESGSMEELKAAVSAFAARRRDKIIIGFGASAHSVAERRLPDRADLDAAAGARPVYLVKYDGHAAVANTALLSRLPARVARLRGYDAESGRLNQEAFFAATDFVTGSVPLPEVLRGMLRAADDLAAKGIGTIHSTTGVGFPFDLDVTIESLFARGLREDIAYRVFFQTLDSDKVLRRKLPRIGGCFAAAIDGCFGSADAALLAPYAHDPANRGVLFYPEERTIAFAKEANRAGLQIQMHAIGDAAFEQAVRALDAALADHPRSDHRHTIIHACLPTERGLDRCAELGVMLAVQPAFLDWKLEPLEYLERILGDRARRISPLKSMIARGLVLTGGSDAPCTLPDPLAGIAAACCHYVSGQRLDFLQALALFTRNAARGAFDEAERGTLEVGKRADFAVLDADPRRLAPEALGSVRAEGLYLAGKPYRRGQGRAELILRGLFAGGRKI